MAINLDISAFRASRWPTRLALSALFTVFAIAFYGIVLSVEYHWMKVLDVQTVGGQDVWSRAVLVDTPERPRIIRTSDRLLWLEAGQLACVSRRELIARRWLRYRLELPGYCRGRPRDDLLRYVPMPGHG